MASKAVFILLIGIATVSVDAINSRIVNGDNALNGEFPYMVSLRSAYSFSHFCGGTIYTPEHIITASHCVDGSSAESMIVVTGSTSNVVGGRVSRVSEIRMHENYDSNLWWNNDIAILKLAAPIPFTATEQPIPLATTDTVHMDDCIISGWGRLIFPGLGLPADLQKQWLKAYGVDECRTFWGNQAIYNTSLCAMSERGAGEGVCSGDSGGPLVCNGALAGVVSWGNPCANGLPDVFARVFLYLDWIAQNTADRSPYAEPYEGLGSETTL